MTVSLINDLHPSCSLLLQWLDIYARKISDLDVFDDHVPNHVLVNEYQAGQGIMVRHLSINFGKFVTYCIIINHNQPVDVSYMFLFSTFQNSTKSCIAFQKNGIVINGLYFE